MKRIWFQFVRKELETAKPSHEPTTAKPVPEAVSRATPKASPMPTRRSKGEDTQLDLRLTGDLWIYPVGEYRPIVVTSALKPDGSQGIRLMPSALHLDIGETRQLDITLTSMRTDAFDMMEMDLPLAVRVRRRMSLAQLHVGDLVADRAHLNGHEADFGDLHAHGTALFRLITIDGKVFNEPFRVRLVEFDQIQVIQGELAWYGKLFQALADQVQAGAGRSVYRLLHSASTTSDIMSQLRRAVERTARVSQARGAPDSTEERDDKPSKKVEGGQDNEHDG